MQRITVEIRNGLSFNCAESVILRTNDEISLSGFDVSDMRIASVLGGGISGCGEVCGAISGGVMCLGLMFGSEGNETEDEFRLRRERARGLVIRLLEDFNRAWGSVRCRVLLAMDEGQTDPIGKMRSAPPRNLCDEYVKWSSKRVIQILRNELSDDKIEV